MHEKFLLFLLIMMTSTIFNIANILKATLFITTATCTQVRRTPEKLNEILYQVIKSVLDAIETCNMTVTYQDEYTINGIFKAIDIIKESNTADFTLQSLKKLTINALIIMKSIGTLNLSYIEGWISMRGLYL